MKNLIKMILIGCMSLLLAFGFAGCQKDCDHVYDNTCDVTCNDCGEERTVTHDWNAADCTTPKTCSLCEATDGNALGHTPAEDDGDCTTEVMCTVCDEVATIAKAEHTQSEDDYDCTTPVTCTDCDHVFVEAKAHNFDENLSSVDTHHGHSCMNDGCDVWDFQEPHSGEDDGDCTTWILCECGWLVQDGNESHTPNEDDGNCLTAITCSICGTVTTEARTAHEGGEATCLKGKLCDVCGFEYDTDKNPDNHASDNYIYKDNGDGTHQVACQCGELLNNREWHSDANIIDLDTGNCPCGAFAAIVSVTVDDVTTYYMCAEDAIEAACSMENSTVVLLEDHYFLMEHIEINSGNFTVELNGKRLPNWKDVFGLVINGGNVVIQDSVGEGEVGFIQLNSGSLTLQGGFCRLIEIDNEMYTPDDILADGYCFYDEDGNVLDISNVENRDGYFELYNVTVGAIQ